MPYSHVNSFISYSVTYLLSLKVLTLLENIWQLKIKSEFESCNAKTYILWLTTSCLLIFLIFIWSGIKEEPKQQNNNRTNLKYYQKNPWNKLFNILHCFAPFTSLTNCAMAFLLSKPTLKHTFPILPYAHLLFHTVAVHYVTIHLLQTILLLAIAVHPLRNQKLFLSILLILFQIFFSFVNITFGFLCLLHCYWSFFLFFQFFLFSCLTQ